MRRFAKVLADLSAKLKAEGKFTETERETAYRDALRVDRKWLALHERRRSYSPLRMGVERTEVLEDFLMHLLDEAVLALQEKKAKPPRMMAAALGGFGRREQNPQSDVDVTFVHAGGAKFPPGFEEIVSSVWHFVLACGFTLGHSTRSIDDSIKEANDEMQSKTAMLEARFLWGDQPLFEKFQTRFAKECIAGKEDAYLQARVADQAERHAKYGETPYMQEPNLKNGCGGLRDYQNLLWMARVKYGVQTLDELVAKKYLNETDAEDLREAYEFVFGFRTVLHYHTGLSTDVILTAYQLPLANLLGYDKKFPKDILRRTEAMMKDYYRHARNIFELTELVSEKLALPKAADSKPRGLFRWVKFNRKPAQTAQPEIFDGFVSDGSRMTYENRQIFKADNSRMMRLFHHMQQRGLAIAPELRHLVRQRLKYVTNEFRYSRVNREIFADILRKKGQVGPVLRAMHRVDFLGKYMPEFGALTAMVQHEFYHRYAVDEHTLVCIEKLDGMLDTDEERLAGFRELFKQLEDPFILYLALLLHDTGKAANAKSHNTVSATNADSVGRRLQLAPEQKKQLIFLVDFHDELAKTAVGKDVDDEATVKEFAAKVKSQENLDALMLLTVADGLGVGDAKMWNDWKQSLVWHLYRQTSAFLADAAAYREQRAGQRRKLRTAVEKLLPADGDWALETGAHFDSMPDRYFLTERHDAEAVAGHIRMFREFLETRWVSDADALAPLVAWEPFVNAGHSELRVVTVDRRHLLARICGSISAAGLSILSADIFTRTDGLVLDTFRVSTTRFEAITDKRDRALVEKYLRQSLEKDDFDFMPLVKKAFGRAGQAVVDFRTRLSINNDTHPDYTVVGITTPDRLGLLHDVLNGVHLADLDVAAARIATEKGAAIDTLYVARKITKDREDKLVKVTAARDLERLETELLKATGAA